MTSLHPQFGYAQNPYNSGKTSSKLEKEAAQRRWDRTDTILGNPNDMFTSGTTQQPGWFANLLDNIDTGQAPTDADLDEQHDSGDQNGQPTLLLDLDIQNPDDLSPEAASALQRYGDSERILSSVVIENAHNSAGQMLNILA